MAETHNIAKMAEEFAENLAKFTRWKKLGPRDMNWDCVQSHHEKKTHPTDAVYAYEDPYEGLHTQILFDFKSLSETSITNQSISKALDNMALALDCAVVSDEFKDLYPVPHDADKKVLACLFVYNHDHGYTKTLGSQIASHIKSSWPKLNHNHEIILLDPETLIYLNSIRQDFFAYIGENAINKEESGFFQPDLQLPYHRRTTSKRYGAPLMLEQATSPFHVLRYNNSGAEEYILYSRCKGVSSDDFILLFDYMMTYQLLDGMGKVMIRLPYAQSEAFSNFEKAKREYSDMVTTTDTVAKMLMGRLEAVSLEIIEVVKKNFLETDMGMRS